MVLTVSAEVAKQVENPTPWDWAIVDFTVPTQYHDYENPSFGEHYPIGGIGGFYIRCVQIPFSRAPEFGVELGAAGKNIAYWMSGENLPTMSSVAYENLIQGKPLVSLYEPTADQLPVQAGSIAQDRLSVRIDMRLFHEFEVLTFEVYGNLYEPADDHVVDRGTVLAWQAHLVSPTDTNDGILTVFELPPAEYSGDGLIHSEFIPPSLAHPSGGVAWANAKWVLNPGGPPYDYTIYSSLDLGSPKYTVYPTTNLWQPYPNESEYDSAGPYGPGEISLPAAEAKGLKFFGGGGDPLVAGANFYATWSGAGKARPILGTRSVAVSVEAQMVITAAVFRGTPPFREVDYDTPDTPGEWAYGQWEIADQMERFSLGEIGQVRVDNVDLDAVLPDYPNNYYYEPEVQRDGRPFLGFLTVSPKKGYASFTPA